MLHIFSQRERLTFRLPRTQPVRLSLTVVVGAGDNRGLVVDNDELGVDKDLLRNGLPGKLSVGAQEKEHNVLLEVYFGMPAAQLQKTKRGEGRGWGIGRQCGCSSHAKCTLTQGIADLHTESNPFARNDPCLPAREYCTLRG